MALKIGVPIDRDLEQELDFNIVAEYEESKEKIRRKRDKDFRDRTKNIAKIKRRRRTSKDVSLMDE